MRKIFSILFAFFVLLFSTQSILAIDSDYKNSLLKIEINEQSQNDYNIGLYTKKIYNEPVKIIRKSDTIYYFLLPETNHAITSTPNGGAIKNIIVKTYPYAGQDINNGYTKVAIITTRPVNLTTSLKTLDVSVSPRLDPARLARLDSVFERYSERLAQNNIPTPLSEFRKTASVQTPSIKSNVNITSKSMPVKIASADNKVNSNLISNSSQIQKTANLQTQTKQSMPVAVPKQNITKQAAVQKPHNQALQTKQSIKPDILQKEANAKATVQAAQKQENKNSHAVSIPSVAAEQNVNEQSEDMQIASDDKKVQSSTSSNKEKTVLTPKEISEKINPIVIDKPVDMKFEQTENTADNNEEANAISDEENTSEAVKNTESGKKPIFPVRNSLLFAYLMLFGGFFLISYVAIRTNRNKKQEALLKDHAMAQAAMPNIKEKFQEGSQNQKVQMPYNTDNSQDEIQYNENVADEEIPEYMAPISGEDESINQSIENINVNEDENIAAFNEYMENSNAPGEVEYAETDNTSEIGNSNEVINIENAIAEENKNFNKEEIETSYEQEPVLNSAYFANQGYTNRDEVIEQLYTPIETPVYDEYSEPASYEEYLKTQSPIIEEEEDDSATIVSASKLTETRGLYLAKFDGVTSLVGYIQDDIYVLYNFGKEEVKDTEIKSTLAQENATDSLYLVKTGGKKLMVKSTPYDMSLEMVM